MGVPYSNYSIMGPQTLFLPAPFLDPTVNLETEENLAKHTVDYPKDLDEKKKNWSSLYIPVEAIVSLKSMTGRPHNNPAWNEVVEGEGKHCGVRASRGPKKDKATSLPPNSSTHHERPQNRNNLEPRILNHYQMLTKLLRPRLEI